MWNQNLDLNLLRTFQHVAEKGGISKASGTLHLSQPAVSLQIQRLEEQLGNKLFERNRLGLKATRFGTELLEHVRQLERKAEDIDHLVKSTQSECCGTLKIGTYATITSHLIPDVVAPYVEKHPNVSIHFVYGRNDELIRALKALEIDCAILNEVPDDPTLLKTPFFQDRLALVCSSKSPLAKIRRISKTQLADVDFVSYAERMELCYVNLDKRLGKYLLQARVPVSSSHFDTLKQMLIRGVGATFLPTYVVREELLRGELREIPIVGDSFPLEFSFVTKRGINPVLAAKTLETSLVEHFE